MKYTLKQIKEAQPASETVFSVLIHRHISPYFSLIFLSLRVTPNMVSTLSLVFGLVAAVFFAVGSYRALIIGAVLIQLALLFDHCDGEVARVAKQGSRFGAWYDGVIDRIREYTSFLGIGLGVYLITKNPLALILSAAAIGNLLLIGYIRATTPFLFSEKVENMKEQPAFLNLSERMHIGSVDTTVFLITFAAIFNAMILLLWAYTLLGLVLMIALLTSKYLKRETIKKKAFVTKKARP